MTPEQATALIVAITGLVGAIGAVFVQLRQTHRLINSRMTELLETTKLASQKTGELDGRDQERARGLEAPSAVARIGTPTERSPTSTTGKEPPAPAAS